MTEERAQRRLAAILAADVVGFSRMMEADEAGTLAVLKARRKDVLEPLVAKHQGRIFKVTGDGVLVEFGSAVNAAQCAVELQQAMAKANEGQPADQQISLTDPDSRSMATSGRGSGVVGYNVKVAVDTRHHLIVTHDVINVGNDGAQLARMAKKAKATLEAASLDVVADRGYFDSGEILACEGSGITVTLPKPMTSGAKAEGRYGKQDFVYVADDDVYLCPAGERLTYRFTSEEAGKTLRRYWTTACLTCGLKPKCATGKERRITRWEHEHVLETVQRRLDEHPEKMRQRRETVEHPFGTIKARMGATHFLTKTLPRVSAEMALHVLAYNLTRVMNIMGIGPLMTAIRA